MALDLPMSRLRRPLERLGSSALLYASSTKLPKLMGNAGEASAKGSPPTDKSEAWWDVLHKGKRATDWPAKFLSHWNLERRRKKMRKLVKDKKGEKETERKQGEAQSLEPKVGKQTSEKTWTGSKKQEQNVKERMSYLASRQRTKERECKHTGKRASANSCCREGQPWLVDFRDVLDSSSS